MERLSFALFALLSVSFLNGQRKESDYSPQILKLYSTDGRESLTANCRPAERQRVREEVTCKFVHVRFEPPPPANDPEGYLSIIEGLKAVLQKQGKDPKAITAEVEKNRKVICAEYRERGAGEAALGPKRKQLAQQLLASCAATDPTLVFQQLDAHKQRTCNLWVDQFTLDFTMVKAGQWLFRQESPGLFSKVLKVYELTGKKYTWTLVETRVPTQGSDERPSRTVWSTEQSGDYELPCEFIKHTLVQVP